MTKLDYMFFEYGEENIRRWCTSLKIFRLCKTYPYPNDMQPDRFIACIQFSTDEELDRMCEERNKAKAIEKENTAKYRELNNKIRIKIQGCDKTETQNHYIKLSKNNRLTVKGR